MDLRTKESIDSIVNNSLKMNSVSKNVREYYFPCETTLYQKDLVEILVSLHSQSFTRSIGLSAKEEDSKENVNHFSLQQMNYLFDNNLRAVINHPCLLVDHYMPRQFLMMEPNERLIGSSDKFQKINQILSALIYRDRKKHPEDLNVALISHNIRELDLLEGLILGKKLKICRLSGTSLYDEKHSYNSGVSELSSNSDSTESLNGTSAAESSSNKYTGYSKDDYSYNSRKQKFHETNDSFNDWIFLTTTTHLMNDSGLISDYDIDIIVSFDPLFDPSIEAIEKLRKQHDKKIPSIKLVVENSPDHYLIANNLSHDTVNEYVNMTNSVDHFLKTRHNSMSSKDYNIPQIIELILEGNKELEALPTLKLSSSTNEVDSYEPKLTPLDFSSEQLGKVTTVKDIKFYQQYLTQKTIERMRNVQKDIFEKLQLLSVCRTNETVRQNDFDDRKELVGKKFQESQNNEKRLINTERRLERSQAESTKLQTQLDALKQEISQLKQLSTYTTESQIKETALDYEKRGFETSQRLETIVATNKAQSTQNDSLRSQYQTQSTQAAELAQSLKTHEKSLEQLKTVRNGKTTTAELEALQVTESRQKQSLKLKQSKNQELKNYIKKLEQHYDLKNSNHGNTKTKNSNSSSYSGSRTAAKNSRYRSTRSTSPAYT